MKAFIVPVLAGVACISLAACQAEHQSESSGIAAPRCPSGSNVLEAHAAGDAHHSGQADPHVDAGGHEPTDAGVPDTAAD
jgi:hypothetical protein